MLQHQLMQLHSCRCPTNVDDVYVGASCCCQAASSVLEALRNGWPNLALAAKGTWLYLGSNASPKGSGTLPFISLLAAYSS